MNVCGWVWLKSCREGAFEALLMSDISITGFIKPRVWNYSWSVSKCSDPCRLQQEWVDQVF